jgi:hypothetical protein
MTIFLFNVMAGVRLLTGVVHLVNLVTQGYSNVLLIDGLFNLALAALALLCANMVRSRRQVVIPAFAGMTLATLAFAVSMGRGVNWPVLALAVFYFLCLWVLRRRNEIT